LSFIENRISLNFKNIGFFFIFNAFAGSHFRRYSEGREKQSFYLPCGKAEDNVSPGLSRVRGKLPQLHSSAPKIYDILLFCNVGANSSIKKQVCNISFLE